MQITIKDMLEDRIIRAAIHSISIQLSLISLQLMSFLTYTNSPPPLTDFLSFLKTL